jgi:hypothetical protein
MAKFYAELNDGLRPFVAAQHVFFNASRQLPIDS